MNFLLEPGIAIYLAMAVALAVWIGIFIFLWRIDRQARDIRQRLDAESAWHDAAPAAPGVTIERRD
jgi:CcmD family protein